MSDKITVQGTYRYSCKVDPTDRDSAWHSAEVSIGFESTDVPKDRDGAVKALVDEAKIQVFTQLGVEFDDNLQPISVVADVPVNNTQRRRSAPVRKAVAAGGKTDLSALPRVTLEGVTYIDFRPAKEAGTEKPRYPDFKTEDLRKGEWLEDQEGQDTEFKQKLAAAGLL